ncbi:MAG: ornithine cyclodeaminase family protein [Paralcaligenes sp.]
MTQEAIWLGEQDISAQVALDEAINALESGLRSLGCGEGLNVTKALGGFDDGSSMHSLGSALPGSGYCGFKNWINTKRGAKAVYVLFDATQGRLLAIMEANALGQLRTAAMTGLGTRWIAPIAADDMAIIGSGRQALAQVAAVNAVRPLKRIRVWSPDSGHKHAFADLLRENFATEVIESPTLAAATDSASLVTIITRARDPFLSADLLAPGTHLNAVGAILPANAEFKQDVFGRVGFIAVDDIENAKKGSRELIEYIDKNKQDRSWDQIYSLGSIIAKGIKRPAGCDISLFKSMGMGVSDLSVAIPAYERAHQSGLGQSLTLSEGPVSLRWKSN